MPLTPNITSRTLQPELMDDPALDAAEHARALAGLRMVNLASRTAAGLWRSIAPLAATPGHGTIRILDLATGSGDIPIAVARLARRCGASVAVGACDKSQRAADIGLAGAKKARLEVGFFTLDAIHHELPGDYDVVMCSLFTHHLGERDVVDLLYKMRAAARRMVLVSDLRRGRAGYVLAFIASRVFSRSRVVHTDALRSVRAAFTIDEFRELAEEAGLRGATIRPAWPCRFLLQWMRS